MFAARSQRVVTMRWWVKFGLLIVLCQYSDGKCPSGGTSSPRFGPSCEYLCHCRNGLACDADSGECSSGCADTWMGPACQYRDIAFNQLARHLDNVAADLFAPRANDGDPDTCSETNDESARDKRTTEPWWRVYFKNEETIRGLIITPKTERLGDFNHGFKITVETIPDYQLYNGAYMPSDSKLCYEHMPGSAFDFSFEIYCDDSLVGNQVRIQLMSKYTQLTLCDVKIFGGRNVALGKSAYGSSQVSDASLAVDGSTSVDPSHCSSTNNIWNPWWRLDLGQQYMVYTVELFANDTDIIYYELWGNTDMDETWSVLHNDRSYYSPAKKLSLSQTLLSLRLVRYGWYSLSICEMRVFGDCLDYQCGLDCSTVCHCNTFSYYEKVTGSCTSGCEGRWTGLNGRCDTECADREWGESCEHSCGHCYADAPCDVGSGVCPGDCAAGYKTSLCTEKCADREWGESCEHSCGHCYADAPCDVGSGVCPGDCAAGYKTSLCTEKCDPWYYGIGCKETCSENCKNSTSRCNHVNGSCDEGCKPGWEGDLCHKQCTDGFYGEGCIRICSSNCQGGVENCDHLTGHCTENCTAGWIGKFCDTACNDGYFGDGCQQMCSGYCQHANYSRTCNHVDGRCDIGCVAGWRGDRCTEECPDGQHGVSCSGICGKCAGGTACDKSNGTCLLGCLDNFHGVYCLQRMEESTGQPASPVAAIAGGVVAAAVIICVILLIIFLVRRRQKGESKSHASLSEVPNPEQTTCTRDTIHENSLAFNTSADERDTKDTKQKQADEESYDNASEHVYYNNMNDTVPKGAVYLSNLKEYVKAHSNTGRLDEEFKSIPYGLQYPTTAALKPANRTKNRYKDMYPYDHSRVLLETLPGQPDSDYINASFIDVCSRPMDNNVADFWRMVWEKNVDTIVMVTNPAEKGKIKCIEYWNKDDDDRFKVSVTSEELFDMMIARTLDLKLTGHTGSRTITQYNFTAWPDKGTPDGATGLVQFLLKCRENYVNKNAPIVVHCSAGVGRTGTYIALDFLYEQGKDLGYVDFLGVVQNLRQQRVNAVQTKGQYTFLHEAVYEAVVLPFPVTILKFPEAYATLLEINKGTQKIRLLEQYEEIQDELLSQKIRNEMNDIKDEEDEFSAAKHPDNKERNRYDNILVANEFRPFLSTDVEGCNDYINAVFVQSHRDSHGFLLSQAPLPYTAVDCCRLVYERSIACIVTFDYEELKPGETYLPKKGKLTIGPFETKFISEEAKGDFTLNSHRIVFKDKTQDVQQFVYKYWPPDQKVPASAKSFLTLVEAVQGIQRTTEGPILVQCLNGAEKSGLFVVLLNVLEKMSMDGDVSIPQTIRLARRRRQQIIPNYEQYKFCHEAVMFRLEENNTYANV